MDGLAASGGVAVREATAEVHRDLLLRNEYLAEMIQTVFETTTEGSA
jgi:hypothetical protein